MERNRREEYHSNGSYWRNTYVFGVMILKILLVIHVYITDIFQSHVSELMLINEVLAAFLIVYLVINGSTTQNVLGILFSGNTLL